MANNTHIVNDIIQFQNRLSTTNAVIELLAPVQFTLETCSMEESNTYVNFLLTSPTSSHYHHFNSQSDVATFNQRPAHHHNFFELMIVLDGEIRQQVENVEYTFHAGNCCLMNRNIYHKEMFNADANILFIGMSEGLIKTLSAKSSSSFFPYKEYQLNNPILRFMSENLSNLDTKEYLYFTPSLTNINWFSILHECSDQLLRTIMFPSLGSGFVIHGLILNLMEQLSDSGKFHISPVKVLSEPDYLIFSQINHIMEDTDGRISRTELEKHLNYSGNYLNTITKKYSGLCIFDLSMKYCMKAAAQLLDTTDLSISDIMTELHFSNSTHFYKRFKKEYSVTPKQY
ncbi:MAG: AraC family transcriptional regulator, partial [Pseudobutyrivibrio sp.]|nr:AraC family transcriptional regulator [Pseudobutyrivibrio sp.]